MRYTWRYEQSVLGTEPYFVASWYVVVVPGYLRKNLVWATETSIHYARELWMSHVKKTVMICVGYLTGWARLASGFLHALLSVEASEPSCYAYC